TGMNAGVATAPWGVVMTPRRAAPSVCVNSKLNESSGIGNPSVYNPPVFRSNNEHSTTEDTEDTEDNKVECNACPPFLRVLRGEAFVRQVCRRSETVGNYRRRNRLRRGCARCHRTHGEQSTRGGVRHDPARALRSGARRACSHLSTGAAGKLPGARRGRAVVG